VAEILDYELAARRHPFAGATATETSDRILYAQPVAIAGLNDAIPSELERITLKCLEKDLERRYQSARDLLAELRQLRQTDESDRRSSFGDSLPSTLIFEGKSVSAILAGRAARSGNSCLRSSS
jgi:serine/threonine-protein kinase